MSYDEHAVRRAVEAATARLSSLQLEDTDGSHLVASLDAALAPLFEEVFAMLMRPDAPPAAAPTLAFTHRAWSAGWIRAGRPDAGVSRVADEGADR